MEPVEQLCYILPTLSSVVDGIDPMRLYDTISDGSSTVHDALDEMMLAADACAHWFRRREAPTRTPPAVYGWVPAKEYRQIMDDLLAAVKASGAMDGLVSIPGGELPAEELGRALALHGVAHGWELATTTGVRFEVPPAVIAATHAFARSRLDDGALADPDAADGTGFDPTHLPRLVMSGGTST